MLIEPLMNCLERTVITISANVSRNGTDGWMMADFQEHLRAEFQRVQEHLEREEAERDKRVAAMQTLLDEALAAHSLADRLQDAMGRAIVAEQRLERQAKLLRAAYERNWFRRLLNWGQY
jgi:hypothetical protein